MKILVTGATGFVGAKLCADLAASGHRLVALTRNPRSAARRLPKEASLFAWDPLNEPPPAEALDGIDAVVHLAGESVVGLWTRAKRESIRSSRVVGTRRLVDALEAHPSKPEVFLCASAVGFYGDRGEGELTEASPAGDGFLADVCREWETEASAVQRLGVRSVRLRIGLVLESDGGALGAMLTPFKLGLGGPLGNGRQWWPWIHRDDLVGLFRFFLEQDREFNGAANATSPSPVRQKDFAKTLGKVLHRPAILPAPAFALRILLGGFSDELLGSRRVLPKAAESRGFEFRYNTLEGALKAALSESGLR
jgi:uncharacterized protein (TIGR01777 family)